MIRHFILSVVLLSGSISALGNEKTIHRCTLDDGTVAFQELPCAEPKPQQENVDEIQEQVPADDFFSFENPFDNPDPEVTAPTRESSEPPSGDRVACEKTTRDSIDAIDAKLNQSKSDDDRETYLAELLELTAQLRACKTL